MSDLVCILLENFRFNRLSIETIDVCEKRLSEWLCQNIFNYMPVHIRETALDTVVVEGQFLVVDA